MAARSSFALFVLGALALAAAVYISANSSLTIRTSNAASTVLPVVAVPGYHIHLFTSAAATNAANPTAAPVSAPDSLVVAGPHVFVDYQNVTAKDCSDGKTSTVVEYTMAGVEVTRWSVLGHSDGMRFNNATHLLWTTSCEDGNPRFATIDPSSPTVTSYTFPTPPHGGGYDDKYFLKGKAYVAASNPTLDSSGNNVFPAVDRMVLKSDHTITLTPILMGNATATDAITHQTVTLNLTDLDSLSTDGSGNLVLVSQADSELISIANPGASTQAVTRLPVATQLDDTVYPSGVGRLLVADGGGSIYFISSDTAFTAGSIYTQTPNDSSVINVLATVSPTTGAITPFAVGFTKATGMVFVPHA